MQSYGEPLVAVPLNHSNLFNAMIYPFTRMVIYGSIWYQGKNYFCSYILQIFLILFMQVKPMLVVLRMLAVLQK